MPIALLLLASGCADEVLLHRLDETQANQVLVALRDAGIPARKEREGDEAGHFAVSVRAAEAEVALGALSARELPRTRAQGFSELFGSAGLVPTPLEEQARYLHALSGELSRTLESLDGVVAARVHLALPAPDPLRPDARRTPRASVLVKCRPDARARIESRAAELARMVSGSADGLEPAQVSVLVAEAASPPAVRASGAGGRRGWIAGGAAGLSLLLLVGALLAGRRREPPA